MKIENLISKVLYKAAPMAPTEFNELEQNMALWFDKQKQDVKAKVMAAKEDDKEPVLNFKDKVVNLLDTWYMRALFAMSYIFIIRWVQDFMNPGEPEYDDQPDDILSRR